MKTPPRYIQRNADAFLEAMFLIKSGKYWQAIELAKKTRNKKLIQRLQQKVDYEFSKSKRRTR